MKYNNIKSLLCGSLLLLAGSASFTSCTDWLDKDPESIIAEDEAFKNYRNFQGYIEEIYDCIPDVQKVNYCTSWNWGDDAVHNPEGFAHMDHQVDLGNYRNIWSNSQQFINGSGSDGSWAAKYSLWKASWYCIRKCNMGIENIGSLVGTDEEREILLGQLYFFRAWWHFELMMYFGGLPYIDKAFEASDIPQLPRLSFQECADRCAEDFERAYDFLPMNWDETLAGMNTSNSNDLRVNKFMALCYLGKVYLWAGSPLMKEFEKTKNGGVAQLLGASSNGKTYDYDVKYCKLASEALGKALNMVIKGTVPYKLAEYKYNNIYDHVPLTAGEDDKAENNYSKIFYSTKNNWGMPGAHEAIFRGVCPPVNSAPWNCAKLFGPKVAGLVEHDNIIHQPTANLVDQYGMANGQPIYLVRNGKYVLNPDSGWDPEHPFLNRDPRFYHDFVFDGFMYVTESGVSNLNAEQKKLQYCDLYTGGAMRAVDNASSTGYFIQKLVPHQCNIGDKLYDWDGALQTYIPYMRLADVYLMYAEARTAMANSISDIKSKPEYCPSLSALDAINTLRDRVNSDDYPMAEVPANLMDTKEHFMDEIRRERTVELSFEGFRWNDLQRWLLLTEPPYTVKYSHEFERLEWGKYDPNKTFEENNLDAKGKPITDPDKITYTWDWFKTHDPKEAKVGNFHKEELITRRLESKHYWFPLPDKDTYLYYGFKQNPGW